MPGLIKLRGKQTRDQLVAEFPPESKTLLVLPDNVPDSSLSLNKLHQGKRGGLAHEMRPDLIKNGNEFQYDLHCVGVPSMKVDGSVPEESEVIAGFKRIFELLGTDNYQQVAVLYRQRAGQLEPAFRGGIATFDETAQQIFNKHFAILEEFLQGPFTEERLVKYPEYQQAFIAGKNNFDRDPINNALKNSDQASLEQDYQVSQQRLKQEKEAVREQKTGDFIGFSEQLTSNTEELFKLKNASLTTENKNADHEELQPLVTVTEQTAPNVAPVVAVNNPDSTLQPLVKVKDGAQPILKASKKDVATEALESHGPTLTALKKTKNTKSSERSFENDQLTGKPYTLYQQLFNDNPYLALAKLIKDKNAEYVGSTTGSNIENFAGKLNSIGSFLEFAVLGARQDYIEAKKNAGKEQTTDLQAAKTKMEVFEQIYNRFLATEALARSKYRYDATYYDEVIKQLLKEIPPPSEQVTAMQEAFEVVYREQLYRDEASIFESEEFRKNKQRWGWQASKFDPRVDSLSLEYFNKRVRIEHQRTPEGIEVKAVFSASRAKYLGTRSALLNLGGTEGVHADYQRQIAEFVTVAIHDYKKGTKQNPINIKWSGANMSDAALGILLEFKKRAIETGQTFYARDPNDPKALIEITPSAALSTKEQEYFLHFAMQKPQVTSSWSGELKESERSAGYKLLKNELAIEAKDADNKSVIGVKLSEHLTQWNQQRQNKVNDKITQVSKKLSNANSQKELTSSKKLDS